MLRHGKMLFQFTDDRLRLQTSLAHQFIGIGARFAQNIALFAFPKLFFLFDHLPQAQRFQPQGRGFFPFPLAGPLMFFHRRQNRFEFLMLTAG